MRVALAFKITKTSEELSFEWKEEYVISNAFAREEIGDLYVSFCLLSILVFR